MINDKINYILKRDESINVEICMDGFIILDSWKEVHKIEAIFQKPIDEIFPDWGFSDEYKQCDNCFNSIHTQSYDKKEFAVIENSFICRNCIRDPGNGLVEPYLELIINNPKRANTILTESILENMGFSKCSCNDKECTFANGLHIGDDDDPKQILQKAIEKNPNKEYIFDITNIDMFTVNFTIWNREKLHNLKEFNDNV